MKIKSNTFLNIIKDLEDKYRFILLEEMKKEKGEVVSQTDWVHLYYLKDYKDKHYYNW